MPKPCPFGLPLKFYEQRGQSLFSVRSAAGRRIAVDLTLDEAAYVVKAVNFHERLVMVLRGLSSIPAVRATLGEHHVTSCNCYLCTARALLADLEKEDKENG